MKVVLDANVIISFLINSGETISIIKKHWINNSFKLMVSDQILSEIYQVIERLIQKGFVTKLEANRFMALLMKKSTTVTVAIKLNISPDKKDNRYLECAKCCRAKYLVTGDVHHLLPLRKYKYTLIISPAKFVDKLISRL